ncbi:hypothetical protein LTR17_014623, partial [Elasticomyces elasticus]
MGLYGQVENVTINPIEALANVTSTMVGMGLKCTTYLDQAWASTPLDTKSYICDWVRARYQGSAASPEGLYGAWDVVRKTVYNNTDITPGNAVTKSIFELSPNATGLLNRTGHHPTTIPYNPAVLVETWNNLYDAAAQEPSLRDNPAYTFDFTDVTRQVLANAFYPLYTTFVAVVNSLVNSTYYLPTTAAGTGQQMLALLEDLNAVLAASGHPEHFSLAYWIVGQARAWASGTGSAANDSSIMQTAYFS